MMSFFNDRGDAQYKNQIRKMFDKADKDKNGKLTKEEWHKILNASGCKTSM